MVFLKFLFHFLLCGFSCVIIILSLVLFPPIWYEQILLSSGALKGQSQTQPCTCWVTDYLLTCYGCMVWSSSVKYLSLSYKHKKLKKLKKKKSFSFLHACGCPNNRQNILKTIRRTRRSAMTQLVI